MEFSLFSFWVAFLLGGLLIGWPFYWVTFLMGGWEIMYPQPPIWSLLSLIGLPFLFQVLRMVQIPWIAEISEFHNFIHLSFRARKLDLQIVHHLGEVPRM